MESLKQAVKTYYKSKVGVDENRNGFELVDASVSLCNSIEKVADELGIGSKVSVDERIKILTEIRRRGLRESAEIEELLSFVSNH